MTSDHFLRKILIQSQLRIIQCLYRHVSEGFTLLMKFIAGPSGRAIYSRSPAAIVGSNPTRGVDVCLL